VGIEPTQPLLVAFGRLATACITNLPVFLESSIITLLLLYFFLMLHLH
jgi:hypothetical protein